MEFIHITAAYSNAVLTAILPHISECAKQLDLPIPQPVTVSQVQSSFPCYFKGYVMGSVILTNGYWFSFDQGYVSGFRSPNNPFVDQDPAAHWTHYIGTDNMTTNEAIQLARDSFRKLGYKAEDYHVDKAPTTIEGPYDMVIKGQVNTAPVHNPYCRVHWDSPESAIRDMLGHRYNIEFAIDMQRKQVVGMHLSSRDFVQPMPKVDIEPELESDYQKRMRAAGVTNFSPQANHLLAPEGALPHASAPELEARPSQKPVPFVHMTQNYSNTMLTASFPMISDFARKLELPIVQPIDSRHVISSHPSNIKDVFGNIVVFTNHYYFMVENGYVRGFGSPDDWFDEKITREDWPLYTSKECMTTNEAVELARNTFRKLGYKPEEFHLDVPPTTFENALEAESGKEPERYAYCQINWEGVEGTEGRGQEYHVEFDINMRQKRVVGMFLSNTNFWRPSPKIDVVPELESDKHK